VFVVLISGPQQFHGDFLLFALAHVAGGTDLGRGVHGVFVGLLLAV